MRFSMTQFAKLIQQLSKATGLKLELDEFNSCSLENDGIIVTVQYLAVTDEVTVFAPVTDPDEVSELGESVLKSALSLSYNGIKTSGNFLGMFDDSLLLSNHFQIKSMSIDEFAGKIITFTTAAFLVRDVISNALKDEKIVAADSNKNSTENYNMPV